MWDRLKRQDEECSRFRDSLEEVASGGASREMLEHSAACEDCAAAAEELLESRELLRALPRASSPRMPWFAPRVMAAIAARESEMRRSLEAWAAVPRFAARLTWVSALALLLASTWLYATPKSTPNSNQTTVETLFDSAHSSGPDDVLPLA